MTALSVVMSGRLAGLVTAGGSAASATAGFEYDPEYLASPDATPVSVSVPLQPGRHEVGVWLDGLLSDNHLVRQRWQTEHHTPSTRAIDLLASAVGRDCAGAVQFCPTDQLDAMLARGGGLRELSERRVASMIATLRTDETAWSQGATDAAFSLAGAQAKTALRYEQGRWWQPYGDYDVCSILPYRDLIQPGTTVPVRQLRLAMKVGRDYTIHKTDYRLAWERTSQALGLPPQETLTRAEELAQGVTAAVEQAIDETPRPMRASPFVARLHAEVKQRADHCAFIQLMHRPSQYAKITPGHDTGSSLRTTSKPAASHPVTRNRCTHIGERSAKRCRLPRGHARPHRYPKS